MDQAECGTRINLKKKKQKNIRKLKVSNLH